MNSKISKQLVLHRLQQAKDDLNSAQVLFNINDYKGANRIREDSDYDDEFVAKYDVTQNQIETAQILLSEIEKYINEKIIDISS